MGSHSLLQGIFLTQELNPGLLHCRQILYHLRHQGSLLRHRKGQNQPVVVLCKEYGTWELSSWPWILTLLLMSGKQEWSQMYLKHFPTTSSLINLKAFKVSKRAGSTSWEHGRTEVIHLTERSWTALGPGTMKTRVSSQWFSQGWSMNRWDHSCERMLSIKKKIGNKLGPGEPPKPVFKDTSVMGTLRLPLWLQKLQRSLP